MCRIPLNKSVYSCEVELNPCPSFRFLSNSDNPSRRNKLHLSYLELASAPHDTQGWVSSPASVTSSHMTCAGLDLRRHSLLSPPINDVFLDGRL